MVQSNFRLLPAACLGLVVLLACFTVAYGYGGGGGGSATEPGPSTSSSTGPIMPLTDEDIRNVFTTIGPHNMPGLDEATVSVLTTIFEGQEMTIRDLMGVRQTILEAMSFSSTLESWQATINLVQVQILDGAGQVAQVILTIVPGVGWGTNAGLGVVRAAADGIRDGHTASEIGGDVLLDGTVSLITYGVPLGDIGDAAINRGVRGVRLGQAAVSRTVAQHLTRRGQRSIATGLVVKGINRGVGDLTKDVVSMSAQQASEIYQGLAGQRGQNQAANQAPQPAETSQVISVPAIGFGGGPVSLPADF